MQVSKVDDVSVTDRMSSMSTTTTASIERRNRDRQASEMQLRVLGRRMKDIEELEDTAIREVDNYTHTWSKFIVLSDWQVIHAQALEV